MWRQPLRRTVRLSWSNNLLASKSGFAKQGMLSSSKLRLYVSAEVWRWEFLLPPSKENKSQNCSKSFLGLYLVSLEKKTNLIFGHFQCCGQSRHILLQELLTEHDRDSQEYRVGVKEPTCSPVFLQKSSLRSLTDSCLCFKPQVRNLSLSCYFYNSIVAASSFRAAEEDLTSSCWCPHLSQDSSNIHPTWLSTVSSH